MLPTTAKPLSASSAAATDESTPPDIPTSTLGGTAPGAASPDVVGTCSALTARQHTHHAVPRGDRGGRTRTPRAGGDWTTWSRRPWSARGRRAREGLGALSWPRRSRTPRARVPCTRTRAVHV